MKKALSLSFILLAFVIAASTQTNTWTGAFNKYWHNAGNWSLGHIPLSTEYVIITTAGYQPVTIDFYDESCQNLTINTGASLVMMNSYSLTVSGTMTAYGNLTMNNTSSLEVAGPIIWDSGSTATVSSNSCQIFANQNWTFMNGANVYLDLGKVTFTGASNSSIYTYDSDCYFHLLDAAKTGILYHGNGSSHPLRIYSSLNVYPSCTLKSTTTQSIIIRGQVYNTGHIQLDNGTFMLDTGGDVNFEINSGDYLNNFTVSTTGSVTLYTLSNLNIQVNGNLVIESGVLYPASNDLSVKGNWDNQVGPSGFLEGTKKVTFNGGNYHQYCSTEIFNILEVNKASGGAFRVNGGNVTCAQYDWTAGAVDVLTGTFTANDLADNAVYGSYYVNTGGTIDLTNSGTGTNVHLNGNLYNYGGTINLSGSLCYWPFSNNATVEMTAGVIDVKTSNLVIFNNATYSLNDNITGGTIRTAYAFSGNRADFTPGAGTIELYGGSNASLSLSNGCTPFNVNINKSSKSENESLFSDAEYFSQAMPGITDGEKANQVSLLSNVTIANNLTITAGTFDLNGYTLNVPNDVLVYGILEMNNLADIMYIGSDYSNVLDFFPGSTANLNAGTINNFGWVRAQAGSNFTQSLSNIIRLKGDTGGGLANYEPTAVFGGIRVEKNPGHIAYISSSSTQPIIVHDFQMNPNTIFEMQDKTMHVSAELYFPEAEIRVCNISKDSYDPGTYNDIMPGNAVEVTPPFESGAKGGYLEVDDDINNSGNLIVNDGNVLCHWEFISDGILTITSGSLICKGAIISGTFTLTSGLIESTSDDIYFYNPLSANISGGIIRSKNGFRTSGGFNPTDGIVELTGFSGLIELYPGDWFYNLRIISTGTLPVYSDIRVINDLIIDNGILKLNDWDSYNLTIGGDFDNNVGNSGYLPGSGTVNFEGTGAMNHQFIYGTTNFYNLTNSKTGGGQLNIAGQVTVINNYLANGVNIITGTNLDVQNTLDLSTGTLGLSASAPDVGVNNFTMGGILTVTDGNFTCTDVTNNGIFGTINLANGSITLNQDASQYPDLNATVTINGGYMAVNGGNGQSQWGWGGACTLNMTSGTLDFYNNGIGISNQYPVTENITGGLIKTNQMFTSFHPNFTPSGGTLELYGGTDAYINVYNNSNLYNLVINKSGGDKDFSFDNYIYAKQVNEDTETFIGKDSFSAQKSRILEFPITDSKANTIFTVNAVRVNGTTTVEEGTFLVDNYMTTCMNNIIVNSGGKLAIGDYGTLAIEDGKSFTINSGGFLDLSGSEGGAATITRNSGYYTLNVESGGTIGAVYGVFEYMNPLGVHIKTGSLVDVAKPFNYCTFRLGQAGGRLMTIENNQTFNVENAFFPSNTWGGTYNVYKAVNEGMVYFITASGGFSGPVFEFDPNNRIFWTGRSLELKAYLEGPFNGTSMNTSLNAILPNSHPFNPALPYFGNPSPDWYFIGPGYVAAIPNTNIVDWVLVELRDAPTAATAFKSTMIAHMTGFILNNGNIVSLDGVSNLQFSNVLTNNLFVVIYHRNHESIMNSNLIPYASGTYSYDFSSGETQVYGGANGHKQLATGIWGMRSGDGDGNGIVELTDRNNVWKAVGQTGKTGYLPSDFNMNLQTNNADKNDKWFPNLGSSSQVPD